MALIQSEPGFCTSSICARNGGCFFGPLRKMVNHANLIVINHALLISESKTRLLNDGLESVGGTAFRVFESLSARQQRSAEGIQDSGFDVIFRALPLVTFHVYDAVLVTPELSVGGAEDTTANTDKLIPDNRVILSPEPDATWAGWIEGSEWVAENWTDFGKEVFGLHTWTTPSIDPAAIELKMLDNGLPALYIPKAVCYATTTV